MIRSKLTDMRISLIDIIGKILRDETITLTSICFDKIQGPEIEGENMQLSNK